MRRLLLVWGVLAGLDTVARADGFMTGPATVTVEQTSKAMVSSPRQEAVLVFDGSRVQVVLRTYFRAGPKDVAWIIPVPATPEDIRPFSQAVFEALESQTAPRFRWVERWVGKGGGFGNAAGGGPSDGPEDTAVERGLVVEATGTAGIFEWTALDARDADRLVRWLSANQYAVPEGAERLFDLYIRNGWHWLAVKVRPEETAKGTLAPHPITYSYRDQQLLYPLAISQLSADAENEIVLYVLGRGLAFAKNWANATTDARLIEPGGNSPSGTTYEGLVRRLAGRNDGRLFMTEFAADLTRGPWRPLRAAMNHQGETPLAPDGSPATFLTRLRAVVKADAMTRDVELRCVGAHTPVGNVFVLTPRRR